MTVPALCLVKAVVGRKVEQRFGLVGLARLLKLVELVADRADPGAKRPSAVMAWGDLLGAIQCDQPAAQEFLVYCEHARVLDRGNDGGRVRLSLAGELVSLLVDAPAAAPKARTLFDREQQWADWFAADLDLPPHLRNDPETRRLFRHWCASNVTVDEVEQAAMRAVAEGRAPSPAILHEHIKALRLEKIRAAS
ncbi:hypothetical protein V0R55_24695 [Pseudomonas soli]|uniref:Uncharacterized protein n=1 Tax=Pseudomonas soli TaxID=1306993 RepID=A0ABU7GWY5_9PSED|nr:hypothetical protein [Pseudomonas soli]MEE1883367.1 hypothetical protein [Pseudomonas soli]